MARGAVVLIISDGWETGDPAVLGDADGPAVPAGLPHRVGQPPHGQPRYQPLVAGMAAAWPYCDAVVSAHSLAALDDLLAALASRSDHPLWVDHELFPSEREERACEPRSRERRDYEPFRRRVDPANLMIMAILPHVYEVTKYDPADRDEHGHYIGAEEALSDDGPVEAAYLAAVAAFAEESGVATLTIREPAVAGPINFGLEPAVDGHGLAGLFPPDLAGYHDGAPVPVATAWSWCARCCATTAPGAGWRPAEFPRPRRLRPVRLCGKRTAVRPGGGVHRRTGLFAERIERSPYDFDLTDDGTGSHRPADGAFWDELAALVAGHGDLILEEGHVDCASRWHRVTAGNLDGVRAGLIPRSRVVVWPDLTADIGAVLAGLPAPGLCEIVWQDRSGRFRSRYIDETDHPTLPAQIAGATAAMFLPSTVDERRPLLAAALPDPDGVLRARWAAS